VPATLAVIALPHEPRLTLCNEVKIATSYAVAKSPKTSLPK
jgi:hypothetical protein